MTQTLNLVEGEVETISGEGALEAPPTFCWVKLKNNTIEYLANIQQAAFLKPGQQIKFAFDPLKMKILQILDGQPDTYESILQQCQEQLKAALGFGLGFYRAKWNLGKILIPAPKKYGDSVIGKLANDLKLSGESLYQCIRFAESYPAFPEEKIRLEDLTWRQLWRGSEKSSKIENVSDQAKPSLPHNEPATTEEVIRSLEPGPPRSPTSGTRPELRSYNLFTDLNLEPPLYQETVNLTLKDGKPQTYILDYCSRDRKRALEVDGPKHDPDDDRKRDLNLKRFGGFQKIEHLTVQELKTTRETMRKLHWLVSGV